MINGLVIILTLVCIDMLSESVDVPGMAYLSLMLAWLIWWTFEKFFVAPTRESVYASLNRIADTATEEEKEGSR